ncbi:Hypothetical predicted protein, partial [Olea europaea subsp. europaea]
MKDQFGLGIGPHFLNIKRPRRIQYNNNKKAAHIELSPGFFLSSILCLFFLLAALPTTHRYNIPPDPARHYLDPPLAIVEISNISINDILEKSSHIINLSYKKDKHDQSSAKDKCKGGFNSVLAIEKTQSIPM